MPEYTRTAKEEATVCGTEESVWGALVSDVGTYYNNLSIKELEINYGWFSKI